MMPITDDILKDKHFLALINIGAELGISFRKFGQALSHYELESCIISEVRRRDTETNKLKKRIEQLRRHLDDIAQEGFPF